MPTYKNDTDCKITDADRNYMEWMPGQERKLNYHIPHEDLGLTKVADGADADTSVQQDWTVELTPGDPFTLKLPYFEAFELSIYATKGIATARIGDGEKTFSIREGESHFSLYSWSRCPYIEFTGDSSATLRVKQEERNTKNTLRRG